jgi:hypothetical protein
MSRISGPKREEVTESQKKKFHNEELHDLYSSTNILCMVSDEMCMTAVHTGVWYKNLKERDHPEDLGIDSRMILVWM